MEKRKYLEFQGFALIKFIGSVSGHYWENRCRDIYWVWRERKSRIQEGSSREREACEERSHFRDGFIWFKDISNLCRTRFQQGRGDNRNQLRRNGGH